MTDLDGYIDRVEVPRIALRFPLELPVPPGFDPASLPTWPPVTGRLEYVGGRLLYMPPSGDEQQDTTVDVIRVVAEWRTSHRDHVVGGNEAGMRLGDDTRAADIAVWRRADLEGYTGGLRTVPPVLAVEVAGKLDSEDDLRAKAAWYLSHGVEVVWLLVPRKRTAHVVTKRGTTTHLLGDRLPEHPALPGLAPLVASLFEQLDET